MPNSRKEYFHQFYLKNREKYIEKAKKRREKINLASRTILANCFRCQKDFFIKYVSYKKRYSLKNNWDYWTKNEENKEKKICNNCLVDLFKNHREEFKQSIPNLDRQQMLRYYLSEGCL